MRHDGKLVLMRGAGAIALTLAALATGCGGKSGQNEAAPGANKAKQAPGALVTPTATDGRLGPALIARPGQTKQTGRLRKLTPRLTLPPAIRNAIGAEANCADADIQPTVDNLAHVSDVIFCLMNAMRANKGLSPLVQQAQLAHASVDHSQDMVDNHYFAHDSLDGRDIVARLKAVFYIPRDGDWVIGENLAWGSGALSTPRSLVNAWMNSPPHRANLLASDYRDVGMGVVYGTPDQDASDGITVTTDFGTRFGVAARTSPRQAVAARRRASRARARCRRRHGAARRRCLRAARRRAARRH
jgi:uncharacterized protein YkwD